MAGLLRINGTDVISGGPRGADGPVGIAWKGVWSSATAYVENDAVSRNGSSYICILANTNQGPPNATYWSVLASGGSGGGGGSVDSVSGTSPIAVDNSDPSNPVISIGAATTSTDGSMSASDKTKLNAIESGATADQSASEVPFTPNGNIASSNVQTAIQEVRDDAASALTAHESDTTNIHGIADTSVLETTTGSASKVAAHEADTTNVHGIADTSVLETTTGSQAKVDNHINDAIDAHDSTAISFTSNTGLTSTDVGGALDEIDTNKAEQEDLDAHVDDDTGAHAASAISYAGGTGISATNVEGALDELANEKQDNIGFTPENVANKDVDGTLAANSDTKYPSQKAAKTYIDAHINDTTDAHQASAIGAPAVKEFPAGTVESQLALAANWAYSLRRYDQMRANIMEIEDWFPGTTVTNTIGTLGWTAVSSGTGAGISAPAAGGDAGGGTYLSTGSTSTGRTVQRLSQVSLAGTPALTNYWKVRVDTLNVAATEECTIRIGLFDNNMSADSTDGAYFEYTPSDTSWHCKTADGGSVEDVDSNVLVTTTNTELAIFCDGVNAFTFLINNNVVATLNTAATIPDSTDYYGPQAGIAKSTGSTAYRLIVSRFYLRVQLPS